MTAEVYMHYGFAPDLCMKLFAYEMPPGGSHSFEWCTPGNPFSRSMKEH